ncbi:histidinol dehydrogenase [Cupriavidus sp. USMAA2-4]|uniref:Histidinol dehydrogenase n=1 Tax=Cupriavidus malaysiensis TaxID=367825 RepID=A0ABM6F8A3_9BURK|nr:MULTISPECIES: histidinol dehydrogenase [Cupriavidus]AOY92540.1 histidinol dehydrogenase [Cupriavidus sp. USMAA2-4]AOY97876.1 histidinol dehydrogenase [Cupriavidus sp. USMAHM13]AOZ01011.1 histidinol dehydrogenase [Cupriavidus sp. USMAHM13]AOZ07752.1 histidinol dehydrogenase [Cupriavidus malaysiensis]
MTENRTEHVVIRQLDSSEAGFAAALREVLAFEASEDEAIDRAAAQILADVKARGDAAVLEYTQRFDRVEAASLGALELSQAELEAALDELEPKRRAALEAAAARVRAYHEKQKIECGSHSWEYTESDGTVLGQKVTPLDRVGLYVPGGKAAYPSSVLMNAIPARVAGVKEVIMVVPTPGGVRNPLVLAAAQIAGVDRVFTIGGAQAVGALAYGTATLPQVDKIVGPGNAYVAAAKRRVFGTVGIDMIAGPSEILVICDGTTDPDWVAMDLFSQAEHDELAQSILLCPDARYIAAVEASIQRQLDVMPRRDVIAASLSGRGALIKVRDMDEACEIANAIAPEHLEISAENPRQWAEKIRHAGAIFLGRFTSESLGDYCAGPNHVLPTSRTARFSSPLGVYDFQKRSSLIEVSEGGAQMLGQIAAELAYGEGLQAHARSAEYRIKRS